MRIAVLADDEQWTELAGSCSGAELLRMASFEKLPVGAEGCVLLKEPLQDHYPPMGIPVFINSVTGTLKELDAPPNMLRINGWNKFLSRRSWEIAGFVNEQVQRMKAALGKNLIQVPDEPGLVSARVLSMIINEAYYALGDKISTRENIDIAMKLGTGYPFGPFEWAALIGVRRIAELLEKLSAADKRYVPAALLKQEASA